MNIDDKICSIKASGGFSKGHLYKKLGKLVPVPVGRLLSETKNLWIELKRVVAEQGRKGGGSGSMWRGV